MSEDAPAPSLPLSTAIEIRGWATPDAEEARLFGNRLMVLTSDYSRWLDLSRLSRIILAHDYGAALAEVQGIGGEVNIATANEFGEGAAMSVLTMEEGVLKSVLVMWTPLVSAMFDEEDTLEKRTALQTYVHELVHVDDQAFLDKTFPGGGSAAVQTDDRHGALLLMVSPAPTEYSASNRTAMVEPTTGLQFLDMLEKALTDLLADVRRQRRAYRVGSISLEEFWPWLQERCRFLFQALGYALGHADAIIEDDRASAELKERYRAGLAKIEAMESGWLLPTCRTALRPILEQTRWTGLEVFDPLIAVGERLLNAFGIYTRLERSVLYVDIPLTRWHDF